MSLKISITLDLSEYVPLEGNIFYVVFNDKSYIITLNDDDICLGRIKSIIKLMSNYMTIGNTLLFVYQKSNDSIILMDEKEEIVITIYEVKSQIFDIFLTNKQ